LLENVVASAVGITMNDQILLHVEDDDIAASMLQTAIEQIGVPIRTYRVADGDEALAFLFQTGKYINAPQPDLVLLDLGLPRRSGVEVLAEIRRAPDLQSLPVVIFSSSSLPADRRKCLAMGALDFITKPPSVQGMTEAIQRIWTYFPQRPAESGVD
jgi:CheY-like chemotaxis protein